MKKQTWLNCIALVCVASLTLLCLVGCTGSERATDTPFPPTPTDTPLPPTPTDTPLPPTATVVPVTPPLAVRKLMNIDYLDGRRLDVYRPEEGSGPFPTVLVLHGYGMGKSEYKWLGEALAGRGYAVVAPSWAPLELAIENCMCVLAWIHANVETYGFDPERIAAFGHSGGGSAAALLATIDDPTEFLKECPYGLPESTAIKGAITYAGSFFMPEWYLTKGWRAFKSLIASGLGIPKGELEDIRQALLDTPPGRWLEIAEFGDKGTRLIHTLPPAWIDGSEPPMLLIHGGSDNMIGRLESEAFADLLKAAGVEVQLTIVLSAKHGLGPTQPGYDEIWNATETFLAEILE